MASYYVWSAAAGSANGSSWANAYTTLTAAFSGHAAGDVYYVAHDHAESTGAPVTLTSNGVVGNPTKVICASRAGSVPPVSADRRTTAQVATTASNGITITGWTHYDGVIFLNGDSSGGPIMTIPGGNAQRQRFDNCSIRLRATGAGWIILSENGGYIEWNNTTVSFANVANFIEVSCVLKWRNTPSALIGTAVPTQLFTPTGTDGGGVECIGVDLSAAGSGKTICGAATNANDTTFRFIDCKLNASVTKSAVPLSHGSTEVDFIRSGASGVNYAVFRHRIGGALNEETTIVRTGGAGATDGTTAIAWKIDTTVNANYSYPFECPLIAIWNDTTGSAKTATVEGVWGGGAVPLDLEIWVDVEYLGDASSPMGSFVNDGAADLLTAGANQTSSSATWGGSTTKFKLNVTFTAQQKGWIYARVKCAKASSTFYIDPLVTLT